MSDTERKDILLRAAYDVLRRAEQSPDGLDDVLTLRMRYDDADCDGACLMDDLRHVLGLDVDADPIPLGDEAGG